MEHEDILLSNAPLFLVHKGWSSRQQQRATAEATQGDTEALIPDNDNSNGNVRTWTLDRQQNLASSGKRENEKGAAKVSSEKRRGTSDAAGHFHFVNTTRPDRPSDPELRKLVMSHVKTGVKRGPNMSKTPKSKSTTVHSSPNTDTITEREPCHLNIEARISPTLHTPVSGASSPFYGNVTFSFPTGPRFQLLLSYYLYELAATWYPLEGHLSYNPVRQGWFRLAMTDEVLFRTMLLSSATHLGRKHRNQNYQEVASLALPILHHVNKRLQAKSMPSDTTISIVSCLAMAELSGGNLDTWKLHMAAIKEMIALRGGINNLSLVLQIKITRADIEGASETIAMPNLLPPQRSSSPTFSSMQDPNSSSFHRRIGDRTYYKGVSAEIQYILQDLFRLSQALCHAVSCGETTIDPRPLDENIIHIHHEVLRLLAPVSTPDRLAASTSTFTLISDLNEATAIVALLFAKSLSRGAGSIATHKRPIIQRLLPLLLRIHKYSMIECSEKSSLLPYCSYGVSTLVSPRLLLWLHFMGGIAARGSRTEFFEESIKHCLAMCSSQTWSGGAALTPAHMLSWQDVRQMLGEVLWFPPFYDKLGVCLWNEVVLRSKVRSHSGGDDMIK